MKDIHIHHLRLLFTLSQLVTMILFPIWLLTDAWDIVTNLHKVTLLTECSETSHFGCLQLRDSP